VKRSALVGIAAFIAVWWLVTATSLIDRLFLPSPWAVLGQLWLSATQSDLLGDLRITLQRTLLGFIVGTLVGVLVGFAMGYDKRVYAVLELPIDFFRSVPATALFPLFIVIFGLGDRIKIFVAGWASMMTVTINTIHGVRAIAEDRLIVARMKRVPFARRFLQLMLPSTLPYICAGARIGMSLGLVVEIVAEMFLGSNAGLGRRVYNASSVFQMEEAYATVVVIGIVGYTLNKLIIVLERRLVHWPNA
jgi:ABC-type nitrate/sulfonate/bicarbonate transport system permease component